MGVRREWTFSVAGTVTTEAESLPEAIDNLREYDYGDLQEADWVEVFAETDE